MPVEHDIQDPDDTPAGNMPMPMGGCDAQIARLSRHMKVMQGNKAMIDKCGMGGMKDKPAKGADTGGMPDLQDKVLMDCNMAVHRQMIEERMQTLQSMMQRMIDRIPPASGKS